MVLYHVSLYEKGTMYHFDDWECWDYEMDLIRIHAYFVGLERKKDILIDFAPKTILEVIPYEDRTAQDS